MYMLQYQWLFVRIANFISNIANDSFLVNYVQGEPVIQDLEPVILTVLHFRVNLRWVTVGYGDIQMTACVLTL